MIALVGIWLLVAQHRGQPRMPATLPGEPGSGAPIWVSAATAVGPDNHLKRQLFIEAQAAEIDAMLALAPVDGCIRIGQIVNEFYPRSRDRSSLSRSASSAAVVVAGIVTGIEPGFYAGEPGELIRMKPYEVLKGSLNNSLYYFFIPVGKLTLGRKDICKTDPAYPDNLTSGQGVLLMVPPPAGPGRELLVLEEPTDLILREPSGQYRLPKQFAEETPALSGAEFLERLRAILSEGGTTQ